MILSVTDNAASPSPEELVRRTFQEQISPNSGDLWKQVVRDGLLAGSRWPVEEKTTLFPRSAWEHTAQDASRPSDSDQAQAVGHSADGRGASGQSVPTQSVGTSAGHEDAGELDVVFYCDRKVHDGRFANNSWLQELPDPVTKLTWGGAALIGPATAEKLAVKDEELVTLKLGGREVQIPVYILPGQAAGTVALPLGYGRRAAGKVGGDAPEVEPVGVDVYPLRTTTAMYLAGGATIEPTGRTQTLAGTQDHHAIDAVGAAATAKRAPDLIRRASLEQYRRQPDFARNEEHPPLESLWEEHAYEGHRWGMSIDLSKCIGCGACVVACQAENNIPVVGREQVINGREMHWLRVDRYFRGQPDNPELAYQPLPCQQCELAPCEEVCPVAATTHTREGLNDMVYNRCVGIRYCANNCPYKVRHFNFFNYHKEYADPENEIAKMKYNPQVTVRCRGVMEKCTYCVQRIQAAKIVAQEHGKAHPRRPNPHRLPAGLPDRSHRVRRSGRPQKRGPPAAALRPGLRHPGRAERPPADDLPGPNPQSESPCSNRPTTNMPVLPVDENMTETPTQRARLVLGRADCATVTETVCAIVERPRPPLAWYVAFTISVSATCMFFAAIVYLISTGVGVMGNNSPVFWAWPIVNFVFWIGIGHAGTLISAILFLFRQRWRTGINRFAEAMTIFAVVCAGIFPAIHVGRAWVIYWLAPYPNQMSVWPNFRSPLLWDVFAVSTYGTVSLLFWYLGMIPDLATLRDRATTLWRKLAYGFFALGWRGSESQWHRFEWAYLLLAALATPLVLSVHSVVSFDFAVAQVPGWHSTIFPPYFVAGAIFSGCAMVVTLAVPARAFFGLKSLITMRHLDNMNKLVLGTGLIVAYSYAIEWFMAWYSGNGFEMFAHLNRALGPYAWAYWTMVGLQRAAPQLFWFKRCRTTPWLMWIIAVAVNVGMWFERFVIIVASLGREFLPSSWGMFRPTAVDFMLLAGSFGLFFTLFLLFCRFLPMVAMAEVKGVLPESRVRETHQE